jgi:NAD(P)-dependent dehydrogenase (short-subunit alcohol dehydrogenase family)
VTAAARSVLVTGASRGIGAATALHCARAGWDVALNCAHDVAAAEQVAAQVRAAGRRALVLRADVADEAAVHTMFERLRGGAHALAPLGALVNNAGVVGACARLDEMDLARWRRLFEINVFGTLLCTRAAVRVLSTRHGGAGGAIVNLSSMASRLGSPAEYVDYAASKGAIDTLTIGLAKELAAEGVRVNAVRPGIIDTEIHASGGQPDRVQRIGPQVPMGRAGTADEVAAAITWLLSADASYVTGALLDVSGAR